MLDLYTGESSRARPGSPWRPRRSRASPNTTTRCGGTGLWPRAPSSARGIARAGIPADASVTVLLGTLTGGAMMHALSTQPGEQERPARDTAGHARRLVDFPFNAVTAPAAKREQAARRGQ
jgi:hypothetical protein